MRKETLKPNRKYAIISTLYGNTSLLLKAAVDNMEHPGFKPSIEITQNGIELSLTNDQLVAMECEQEKTLKDVFHTEAHYLTECPVVHPHQRETALNYAKLVTILQMVGDEVAYYDTTTNAQELPTDMIKIRDLNLEKGHLKFIDDYCEEILEKEIQREGGVLNESFVGGHITIRTYKENSISVRATVDATGYYEIDFEDNDDYVYGSFESE